MGSTRAHNEINDLASVLNMNGDALKPINQKTKLDRPKKTGSCTLQLKQKYA